MLIALAIDRIAELATESEDYEIIVSSTAALKTLGILQQLGFKSISIDPNNNMMTRD
tara:strand:- start:21 stop:191 length:171 start_codon:yes stop_codon:yes gene_type:complete